MTALDQVKQCLLEKRDFVLQGGAGSGKTETLKELLSHISLSEPYRSVACITLTNKAADEIRGRVGDKYHVSTIHSFLHSLIDKYRESIKSVLGIVFQLEPLACAIDAQAEIGHDEYKKRYREFVKTLYRFKNVKSDKVVIKREYDKDRRGYVINLSHRIMELNEQISTAIGQFDARKIRYNESSFNNIRRFSYGHDGLLKLAAEMIRQYPILQRILGDKFDYIFIDEYQDTSPEIVKVFIDVVAKKTKATLGLFGDSMQGIYQGGVGDVEIYIESGDLRKIEKEDNFRCSRQVVDFLNTLRLDTLRQKVALKHMMDGTVELAEDREGTVNLHYAVAPYEAKADKQQYLEKLKSLIGKVETFGETKYLMLTNKSIAGEVGFATLYEVFTARYGQERGEEMERILTLLQFDKLTRLCTLFKRSEFNELISLAKNGGFGLNSKDDKIRLYKNIELIVNSNESAMVALNNAFACKLLLPSESFAVYMEERDEFLKELEDDIVFQSFLMDMADGINTAKQMKDAGREMDEFVFEELKRKSRKKDFYDSFFGDSIKFSEIVNYFDYLNDEKPFVTMHKTKGTGIENVVVVLDEYFWLEYDFKNILTPSVGSVHLSGRKLVYVACSRAIKNLTCVRLISEDEETELLKINFSNVNKFDYSAL